MATLRREFLRNSWKLGGSLLGVAAGWTVYESLRPLANTASGAKIKLAGVSAYPPGSATAVTSGRLYIVNTGSRVLALSQKCPHLGCRVPFCESSGQFECNCHGSKFNIGGEWIAGPAPNGMDRYRLSIDGDNIVVDTSALIKGPDHGTKRFTRPAKGPSCAPGG